jgi:3-deoxy-D-manno-octulosonic-acid transferase
MLIRFLYTIGIYIYGFIINLIAIFGHKKAKSWIKGRRQQKNIYKKLTPNDRWIWIHVSSLGEFEQARTVIDQLHIRYKDHKILLTFFSPSGYEIRKNYPNVDMVLYLPLDVPRNIKKFIAAFLPELAIFVKYDFWFNYLYYLKKNQIPTILISAVFRPNQYFFRWYGMYMRRYLKYFDHIFVQNSISKILLEKYLILNVTIAGDTRFDRVYEIAQNTVHYPQIEKFISNRFVYIAGSSWEEDEKYIYQALKKYPDWCYIIAPHEVHNDRINKLKKSFKNSALTYSELNDNNFDMSKVNNKNILIIDTIGILSHLYKYADIVHIGNGFGKGIHNILEAAVYGKPIIFGPNYKKFQEAIDLVNLHGAFSFNNINQYLEILDNLYNDKTFYNNAADVCKNYIQSNVGATNIILKYIDDKLKETW